MEGTKAVGSLQTGVGGLGRETSKSIGCGPCTRRRAPGLEEARTGRWAPPGTSDRGCSSKLHLRGGAFEILALQRGNGTFRLAACAHTNIRQSGRPAGGIQL